MTVEKLEINVQTNAGDAAKVINGLANALERTGGAGRDAGSGASSTARGISRVSSAAKKASGPLSNFANSIKRIAMYRAIRAVIKAVTEAIKEGAENFYNFTKTTENEMTNYANALDGVKAASSQMKNQLGAAFGSLYTAVAPIIESLISLVTRLANALTMIFARLGGATGWYRATEASADAISDVGGAAKEAMRYLAPFDELNRLPSNSGGGGGGSTGGNGGGYEWVDFEQFDIADGIASIFQWLEDAFNNAANWIESVDWLNLASDIVAGLSDAFSKVDWAGVTSAVAEFLGAALGAVAGFLVGAMADLVTSISDGIYNAFHNDDGTLKTGAEIWNGICEGIVNAIKNIGTWVKTNIVDPFVAGIKSAFGIHSPASEMMPYGNDIANGLLEGIKGVWSNIKNWLVENVWNPLKNAWNDIVGEESIFYIGAKAEVDEITISPTMQVDPETGLVYYSDDNSLGIAMRGAIQAIEDNIDPFDRIIGDLTAGFNKAKNNLSAADTTFDSTASFETFKNGANFDASKDTTWNATASFTRFKNGANFDASRDTTWNATASFNKFKNGANFDASKDTTWSATASFNKFKNGANFDASKDTTWSATASFNKFKNGANFDASRDTTWSSTAEFRTFKNGKNFDASKDTTWSATAAFNYSKNGPDWKSSNTTWNATANFSSYTIAPKLKNGNYLSVEAKIDIKGQVNTPTIEVKTKTSTTAATKASGGVFKSGAWKDIPQFASGGSPHGSLFIAGEAGAELVGHIGGSTEVLNQSQIASAIAYGVTGFLNSVRSDGSISEEMLYRAFRRALDETDFGGDIELDGQTLYQAMVRRNRMNTVATGVNAMA